MGTGSGDDGDEEPSENDDGNKRNRFIKKNNSDGSSTE